MPLGIVSPSIKTPGIAAPQYPSLLAPYQTTYKQAPASLFAPRAPVTYEPLPPIQWGKATPIQTPTGLNPGMINPTPAYQNTSPSQNQYYWGARPGQAGSTFNAAAYNAPAAGTTPFGLPQMTTGNFDIAKYLKELNTNPVTIPAKPATPAVKTPVVAPKAK